MPRNGIAQREWIIALGVAVATAVIGMIPYLLGSSLVPDGVVYTHLIMNPEDAQTYWAKMLQGFNGSLLYTIPFTPEPHQGAFVGIFYVWLGYLGRLTGLSLTTIWYWSRTGSAIILYIITFRFAAEFFPANKNARWTAYLLAIFGSGLGWLLFAVGQPYWLGAFPVDFKQPGAHLFFTALTYPHIILGTAVILVDMLVLKKIGDWYMETGAWRLVDSDDYDAHKRRIWLYATAAGFGNILLGIVYPFLIYIVALTALLYWLYLCWRSRTVLWQQALMIALLFVIPAPLYLYYLQVWRTNPIFQMWNAQAGTPALPWPHYLLAYGLMLALGLWFWWKKPEERRHFAVLWLWVLAAALLLFSPINAQRRFVQGVHVALAVLAAAGLVLELLPRAQRTWTWIALTTRPRYTTQKLTRFVLIFFLIFMSLSNLYLLADVTMVATVEQPYPLFRPADELAAVNWLRENAPATAVVLGEYETGNYVAAQAGQRVVLGHWAETMHYAEKETAVTQFFTATTPDSWRDDMLLTYVVNYVWYGPREKELGSFDPASSPYLELVYENDTIQIYRVTDQLINKNDNEWGNKQIPPADYTRPPVASSPITATP